MQEQEPASQATAQPEPAPEPAPKEPKPEKKLSSETAKVETREEAREELKEETREELKEETRKELKEGLRKELKEKEGEKEQAKSLKRAPARPRERDPAKPTLKSRSRKNRRNATKAYELPEELCARPPATGSLRIVSANLRNGQVDPEAFADLVAAMRADIVALQEAGRAHFEALSPELPHGEFETAPSNSGLGIALRSPATPGRIDVAWRGARLMSLDPKDWPELQRPLEIVNVHIAPPHFYKPPLYGFVIRNQQVRALENHFSAPPRDDPASQSPASVLIGDFNATPLWPLYRRIASQFTDAAIAVAQVVGRPAEPTWSLPANTPRRLRIDHAFVRGVTPQEFQAVRIAGSDHSAIVVDIADRTNQSSSSSSSS